MTIEIKRKAVAVAPATSIEVRTGNAALMSIEFNDGVQSVTLKQVSPLSGEPRLYVWDEEALRELAEAIELAADELEARG